DERVAEAELDRPRDDRAEDAHVAAERAVGAPEILDRDPLRRRAQLDVVATDRRHRHDERVGAGGSDRQHAALARLPALTFPAREGSAEPADGRSRLPYGLGHAHGPYQTPLSTGGGDAPVGASQRLCARLLGRANVSAPPLARRPSIGGRACGMMSADVVSSMDDTEPRAYRLVRPLGRGGSSWVWEAEPVGDAAKRVVVKRL